jgi:hypothetical protein
MRAIGMLVLCTAAVLACDEEETRFQIPTDGGPSTPDTGTPVRPDAGNPSTGPVVELKNVTAISDPLQGPVLMGASLEVLCEAKQRTRGTAVDIASVRVQLLDATNKILDEAPLASQGVDIFKGSVALTKVPTGLVRVRCAAKDTTTPTALNNWSDVTTYYDAGPTITIEGLDDTSIVPRGSDETNGPEFTIQFKVDPAPLASGDTGAEVNGVVFKLRDEEQVPIKTADGWKFDVDFEALVGTGTAIDELKIEIVATNKRTPTAATATKVLVVKVDSKPPTITVVSPATNTIVGGRVKVILNVTDDLSGVSANTDLTYATLGDIVGDKPKFVVGLDRVPGMPNTYTFDFDASNFPGQSDIPINITASDNVGNKAVKDIKVRFDTVPPWVSLESPYVRDCTDKQPTCSGRFKALGASPQDGAIVGPSTKFRTLVLERGIVVDKIPQVWISGIQDNSVILYTQPATASSPLVVDNDGDGVCDALAIDLVAGSVTQHTMSPVGAAGIRPPSGESESLLEPAIPSRFTPLPSGELTTKCDSDLYYAITQFTPDRATAVYAFDPTGTHCDGVSFNLGSGTGWTCIVAVAMDNSGNLGISNPIRVCRTGGTETCSSPMPANLTCRKDCTMPPASTVNPLGSGLLVY